MSGHSKWSTIKHKKELTDKKKGKAFSKVAKAISIAVKEGKGGDPQTNPRLRLAIEQARAVNMPKDNIKRAIERGLGKEGEGNLETIIYEGFGPVKTMIIVECITDNKNRTTSEIKSFFERVGGGLGSPGSVSYLFQRKGMILIAKDKDVENQILKLIDLAIEDVEEAEEGLIVFTKPEDLSSFREQIEKSGFNIKKFNLEWFPKAPLIIKDVTTKEKIINFLNRLEEREDVQKVYCNADFAV